MTATAQSAPFYPFARPADRPFDPPDEYVDLRAQHPVTRVSIWDGSSPWLITRYADCRDALGDHEHFSSIPTNPGFPEKNAATAATIGQDSNLRTMDEPDHREHQRMLIVDFSKRRVDHIRAAIEATVTDLMARMREAGPGLDFVEAFSLAVPTLVICELLGVPYRDRDFFAGRAAMCMSGAHSFEDALQAGKEINEYIDSLLTTKLADPADDMLSRLAGEMRAGRLTRPEVVAYGRLMLIAGHETSAKQIALSTVALLADPDQMELLRSFDDPKQINNAVEELLRYLSVSQPGQRRVCVKDRYVGDTLIRAGEGVVIATASGNRDEAVFPGANRIDLSRPNARTHLAFGYGIHQCIGQTLARAELQVVFARLYREFPTMRLAVPFDQLRFTEHDGAVYGIHALPIEW